MKTYFILTFFILLTSANLSAQTQEKKVEAAAEFLRNAMINGDQMALEKITDDNLQYGHSSGKLETKTDFVNTLVSKKSDFVTIDITEQSIKVTGKTAIVRHKLAATTYDSGKLGEVKLGVMLVFVFKKGDWKLLGRQAYKI